MHKSLRRLPLRILWAGCHQVNGQSAGPLHQHDVWEMLCCREGRAVCRVTDCRHDLEPGTFLLVPPRTPHAEAPDMDHSIYSVGIAASAAQPWPASGRDDPQRSVQRLCAEIVAEFATKRRRRGAMLDLLAQQLRLVLDRLASEAVLPAAEATVRKAEALMHASHASGTDVAKIARLIQTTPATLRRHFAQLRDCSPLESLQKIRLRHALHLLAHSDLTLADIAAICGYHSASHLSRCVKATKGKSPGRLRGKITA
ncbi:MAG: helix-turn-helix domain-containing protein [Verrucomicrobia bacterium]|nr:helix-turn-helix domain-containing protein [Verrucomicrobiota bacterium]MBV9659142.1 helix-turn-helix domain-containing protein [Verrucomicrobiota bacterium]